MNATFADIILYLAIGGFFIMMMRKGGCCGSHGHKEQKQGSNESRIEHK